MVIVEGRQYRGLVHVLCINDMIKMPAWSLYVCSVRVPFYSAQVAWLYGHNEFSIDSGGFFSFPNNGQGSAKQMLVIAER